MTQNKKLFSQIMSKRDLDLKFMEIYPLPPYPNP
jgi:hypothetical protein